MKVSVITPSFNQGRFISNCINSVRSQTGDFDVEHIILDNCSTDETAAHLAAYSASPGHVQLKVIVEKDDGQSYAINRGFELASGDIVCWLNTDEWYMPDTLQNVVNYFLKKPAVDVLFGDCNFYDEHGKLVNSRQGFSYSRSMLLYYGCYISSCSTFVRREIIDKRIFLDPSLKVTMDFEWYLRISDAGFRIEHISEVLACFTWHNSNISSTFSERRKHERHYIQTVYSRLQVPKRLKPGAYRFLRYYWQFIRFSIRLSRTPSAEVSRLLSKPMAQQ